MLRSFWSRHGLRSSTWRTSEIQVIPWSASVTTAIDNAIWHYAVVVSGSIKRDEWSHLVQLCRLPGQWARVRLGRIGVKAPSHLSRFHAAHSSRGASRMAPYPETLVENSPACEMVRLRTDQVLGLLSKRGEERAVGRSSPSCRRPPSFNRPALRRDQRVRCPPSRCQLLVHQKAALIDVRR